MATKKFDKMRTAEEEAILDAALLKSVEEVEENFLDSEELLVLGAYMEDGDEDEDEDIFDE